MRTQSLAVVFFEVVGYAETAANWTGQQSDRALALHRDLLFPALAAFGGRLIKVSGGSYLATFESPTNAALCAAALHDRAAGLAKASPGDNLQFRVGAAMGEIRLEQKDIFGDAVNIAARIVALAAPGEILLAEVVYLAMNKAEVPSEEVGVRELKGIPEKVRVYRVPRGVYRLSAAASAPGVVSDLPYGGLGLAHAPQLAPVSASRPGSASSSLGSIERVRPIAAAAASSATKLANRVLAHRRLSGATLGLLLAGAGVGYWLTERSDPIERSIDRGDLESARVMVEQLPKDGRRVYLEGRLLESSQPTRAVTRYVDAARQGEKRAARRLITLLDHSDCDTREHAARALGALADPTAREGLQRLANKSDDQGVRLGILSFGCNPASAAKDALRSIDAADGGA